VNLAVAIAVTAAAINLAMAALHFAIARAPGWRIARLFAGLALTAGVYNALSACFAVQGLSDAHYLIAGRLTYLVASVHVVLWIAYAYSDRDGSWKSLAAPVQWLISATLLVSATFACAGGVLYNKVGMVDVAWARTRYTFPLTTPTGDVFGMALAMLGVLAFLRLSRRFRQGERSLGLQIALYGVFCLCAIDEVLVANRVFQFPSLLDFGFVLIILPLSIQTLRRIVNDAEHLDEISHQLESQVARRTEERDDAKGALTEAEGHIRDLVASLDAIVWEADAATLDVVFLSQGVERLLNYEAGQGTDAFWGRVVHPEDRERVLASAREALSTKNVISLEYRVLTADGRIRWFRDSIHPVAARSGVGERLRGVMFDVTESRLAHQALSESEETFRVIFQEAAVGVALVGLYGKVLIMNDRCCQVLRRSREEMAGKRLIDITHPDDRQLVQDNKKRLLDGDAPSCSMEKRFLATDGSVIWSKVFLSLVRDAEGLPQYYVLLVEDISERKRAESALIESEARFRHMADNAPAMMWLIDPEGLATFFNTHALTFAGLPMERLTGRRWAELLHPDEQAPVVARVAAAIASQGEEQMEYRIRRADGEYRSMLAIALPRFSGGAYVGHIGISVDITDWKRAHDQALANQKLESLGVLAGGIAHDFNNLLGSILADAELAIETIPEDSPARDGVHRIKLVSIRAAGIVRQMMAYAGQEDAVLETLDLSALIAEMVEFLKVSISKRATLVTELAVHLPPILANAAQIRQVVMNFIMNASEAIGDEPGIITISTSMAPPGSCSELPGVDCIRLEVADTGCGMTDEVQARAFDPFYTTKKTGRGLGLASAQGIIRAHGGTIGFTSRTGSGTCFEVLLPAIASITPASTELSLAGRPADSLSGKVLMVEDEETLRSAVVQMLRKRGFAVLEAHDGDSAVELFYANQSEIEVVLLDMTLPGLSGAEVLAEINSIRPSTRIILTTAYGRPMAMQATGGKAWGFLRKPYAIEELEDMLRSALANGSVSSRAAMR
jgi:PAS domain S-box-containing protein